MEEWNRIEGERKTLAGGKVEQTEDGERWVDTCSQMVVEEWSRLKIEGDRKTLVLHYVVEEWNGPRKTDCNCY